MVLPTILLIHGAWHTPETYGKLTKALKAQGYTVHAPRLPSLAPGSGGLPADIDHVRSLASNLLAEGHRLVVIMHSYGGQVGTSALAGLGPGILHLIYMCAFAMPKGVSLFDSVREAGLEDLLSSVYDINEDGTVALKDPRTMFFGELRGEEVEGYVGSLIKNWDGGGMYGQGTGEAWREVPCTYVATTEDKMVDIGRQKLMIEYIQGEGANVEVVELKEGHCPNLTATDEVVRVVRGLKVE